MSDIPAGDGIAARLRQAASLPETLTAALDAFEAIRMTARAYQDQMPALFAAFLTAADAAVDGREALICAPSFHPDGGAMIAPVVPAGEDMVQAADTIAALAAVLHSRLTETASLAHESGDQDACLDAAAAAGRIAEFMTRADR